MKLSSVFKPLIIAAALAAAGSANALVSSSAIPADVLDNPAQITIWSLTAGDSFSYTFSFSVTGNSSFDGYVYSENVPSPWFPMEAVGFDLASLTLGGSTVIPLLSSFVSGDAPSGELFNKMTFSASNLAAGQYDLTIQGNLAAKSTVGGYLISGNLAPVPEPENYAMLLAGLGIIGAMARRNRA